MKDWFTLEPDEFRLMNKHFSHGRGGRKIEYVTRHHMGGIGGALECWNWWQTRQASAHYSVDPAGKIGQLVYDRDTAWSNANPDSNQRSIAIEHSNSAGPAQDWPISPATIREGARLAAAICFVYKLGRPVFGKNIRDHSEFTGTQCPYHLRSGWKYHAEWMRIAVEHYDWMARGGKDTPKEGFTMDEATLRRIISEEVFRCLRVYVGPIGSDVKDMREQLTGARDLIEGDIPASYPGWSVQQLLESARSKKFDNLTVTELAAASLAADDVDKAVARRAGRGETL